MARKDGLPLRGHPVLLRPGPAVQGVRPPGVKDVPSGASCQRTGESSSWSSPDSCTARCGRGICCVVCPRSWSGKASVSAPPPPGLATAFLRRVRSAGPATTCQRKTLRIQQRGGPEGTRGTLWITWLLSGGRTEPDFPSVKWARCYFALPIKQATMSTKDEHLYLSGDHLLCACRMPDT